MNIRRTVGKVVHRIPMKPHGLLPPDLHRKLKRQLGRGPEEMSATLDPPIPGPDMKVGAPDFIGIGVQKAATDWWYYLICDHPAVQHPTTRPVELKELHYFSRFGTRDFGQPDIEQYHRWFPRSSSEIAGEWTPDYIYLPWVPYLVSLAAPDVRLIVCLRDPVERFRSGLAHNRANFFRYESPSIADTVNQGFYAASLKRWMNYFRPDQFLILQFEAVVREPLPFIRRTYEFLGIDPEFVPDVIDPNRRNKSPVTRAPLGQSTIRRLVDIYRPDVQDLLSMTPDIDVSLWPNFA